MGEQLDHRKKKFILLTYKRTGKVATNGLLAQMLDVTNVVPVHRVRAIGSYGFVSGICYLLNNALLITMADMPLWANLAASAAIVISLGYVLQSKLTFKSKLRWAGLGRYSLVMLPNIPVAYLLLWLLNHWLPMLYSAPIVTTILLVWNAVGSVWALRSQRPKTHSS